MKHWIRTRAAVAAALSLLAPSLCAQTFDKVHYNIASGASLGSSVRETPNGYIVFGVQTQLDTNPQDCTISKFDIYGSLINEDYIHRSRYEVWGRADPIGTFSYGNGFIGLMSSFGNGVVIDTLSAVRFGPSGDTLWSKPILFDTTAIGYKTLVDNNKFYFTGIFGPDTVSDELYSAYILRTDTFANAEYFHIFPLFEPYSMAIDQTSSIYLAGTKSNKGYTLKADSSGNVVWQAFQPKIKGNWFGIKHIFTDKLLCMGNWIDLQPGSQPDTSTMYLCMYNEAGQLLWQYEGLKDRGNAEYATFTDGYQDSDSTFIVTGPIQQLFWNRALIYRFTAGGVPLWRRDYAHFDNLNSLYPQIPWDIEPTSDGGMVLTGETWDPATPPRVGIQNMWLLKLDYMGCLIPGCQYVGINDIAFGLEHALKAWPNPSNGRVSLALELPEGLPLEGGLLLQVFDARGRLVVRQDLGNRLVRTIPLDLSGQPAGLYSAHISDARHILTGIKLVVE